MTEHQVPSLHHGSWNNQSCDLRSHLCEIIATQLGSGAFPPIIERVDVRVAADGVGQQLLTPLWRSLTSLGKEVDAVVLYQDDAAFVRLGLGEHGAQVGTFET